MHINEIRSISNLIKFFGGGKTTQINNNDADRVNTDAFTNTNLNTDPESNTTSNNSECKLDVWEIVYAPKFFNAGEVVASGLEECKQTDIDCTEVENQDCNYVTGIMEHIKTSENEIDILNKVVSINSEESEESVGMINLDENHNDDISNTPALKPEELESNIHKQVIIDLEEDLCVLRSKSLTKEKKCGFEEIIKNNENRSWKKKSNFTNETNKFSFVGEKYDCFYTGTIREGVFDKYSEARRNKGYLLQHLCIVLTSAICENGLVKPSTINFKDGFEINSETLKERNWNKFR
jgi:hypothetical protein